MVTVHREAGLRFVIYTDDHLPAHVHVHGDGSAKIPLAGSDGTPEIVRCDGMKGSDIRKAMQIVADHQDHLFQYWRKLNG